MSDTKVPARPITKKVVPVYGRQHYREVDWRRERLRQPPRGYYYVRDDRGEILLVGIATGVILSILLNN